MEASLETEINDKGKNKTAKITLISEEEIFVNDLFVKTGTLKFTALQDSSYTVISLENVKEIRFKYHFEGALLGLAAGGYLFNAIGINESERGDIYYKNRLLWILGAAWGFIIGGSSGIQNYYEFEVNQFK